jgi:hypothetical protein
MSVDHARLPEVAVEDANASKRNSLGLAQQNKRFIIPLALVVQAKPSPEARVGSA